MSALRSLKRNIAENLIAVRCNRYDTKQDRRSFKANRELLAAAAAMRRAKADPMKHRAFAKRVQYLLNVESR